MFRPGPPRSHYGLCQPLQTVDEKEPADDQAHDVNWDEENDRRAEDDHQKRQGHEGREHADQGGSPLTRHADRENDGDGFDELDCRRDDRDQSDGGHARNLAPRARSPVRNLRLGADGAFRLSQPGNAAP